MYSAVRRVISRFSTTHGPAIKTSGELPPIGILPILSRAEEYPSLFNNSKTLQIVIEDLKNAIERIAPRNIHYAHDSRWGDGNGFAHVRAALLGPSLSIPFSKKRMLLGTWQQIILVDFDNRPRTRQIFVQIIGE